MTARVVSRRADFNPRAAATNLAPRAGEAGQRVLIGIDYPESVAKAASMLVGRRLTFRGTLAATQLRSVEREVSMILLIVARKDRALYDYQTRRSAGHRSAEVILDRRYGERRRQSRPVDVERRHGERRRHRGESSILGFTIVRRVEQHADLQNVRRAIAGAEGSGPVEWLQEVRRPGAQSAIVGVLG